MGEFGVEIRGNLRDLERGEGLGESFFGSRDGIGGGVGAEGGVKSEESRQEGILLQNGMIDGGVEESFQRSSSTYSMRRISSERGKAGMKD